MNVQIDAARRGRRDDPERNLIAVASGDRDGARPRRLDRNGEWPLPAPPRLSCGFGTDHPPFRQPRQQLNECIVQLRGLGRNRIGTKQRGIEWAGRHDGLLSLASGNGPAKPAARRVPRLPRGACNYDKRCRENRKSRFEPAKLAQMSGNVGDSLLRDPIALAPCTRREKDGCVAQTHCPIRASLISAALFSLAALPVYAQSTVTADANMALRVSQDPNLTVEMLTDDPYGMGARTSAD